MTASWVEEQLVSPESIPLRIARRHENSSRQSPEKLIKIKLAFFMTWLTHPQHRLMKVSFCLISSWLKAASFCWLPFLSQTRFPVTHLLCPLLLVLPGTRSKEWPKHYLVKRPCDYIHQRILRVELLFLQKFFFCFFVFTFVENLSIFVVALPSETSTSGHWTPTTQI